METNVTKFYIAGCKRVKRLTLSKYTAVLFAIKKSSKKYKHKPFISAPAAK